MKILFLIFHLIPLTLQHSMGMGACPKIKPLEGFEMDRFNGTWFVIQKVDTSSTCLKYDFDEGKDGKYRIIQSSKHYLLDKVGVDDFTYTGVLTVPDSSDSARMRVKFPLNVMGESDFIIFATDYETYGAVFSCQKILVGHTKSAAILSRELKLNDDIIDKIRSQLKSDGMDPSDLDKIDHSKCVYTDENYNLKIDDKTFSRNSTMEEAGKKGPIATLPAGAAYGYAKTRRRKPLG